MYLEVLLAHGRTRLLALAALVALVPVNGWGPQGAGASSTPDANLLTGDTATLLDSIGTWVGQGAKIGHPSAGVLSLTATSTSVTAALSGVGASAVPASPGLVYTGSLSVRSARTTRQVSAVLQFRAQDGTVLARAFGSPVSDPSSTWTLTRPVVGIAPEGTTSVVLAELVASPVLGEVHYLRAPRVTVAPAGGRDVVGPLRTSGNTVYDGTGSPVVLRGINRRGLELANPMAITTTELAHAKRWGATMIRLQVSSSYWLTGNCNYKSGYAATVDKAVAAITSLKMVALVDLHTNTMVSCGPVKQQRMADASALDFWRQVATRYRDNPLVAFDLYNEPHDISNEIWLNGGKVTSGGTVFTAVGMQTMYDAVRSTGAENLVFVSGQDWASNPPAQLVEGRDIVYALHDYTCTVSTDPSKCAPNPLDPTPVLKRWETLASTVPVSVTEFGWPDKGDGRFNENLLRFVAERGWGWAAFAWDGGTNGQFSLLSTMATTFEPSPAGMPVLAALNPTP